jgi:hypothetical protein
MNARHLNLVALQTRNASTLWDYLSAIAFLAFSRLKESALSSMNAERIATFASRFVTILMEVSSVIVVAAFGLMQEQTELALPSMNALVIRNVVRTAARTSKVHSGVSVQQATASELTIEHVSSIINASKNAKDAQTTFAETRL